MSEQNHDQQSQSPEGGATEFRQKSTRPENRDRPRRPGGHKPFNRHGRSGGRRPGGRFQRRDEAPDPKTLDLIKEIELQLKDSLHSYQVDHLSPLERKHIHRHFERSNGEYTTKTYRREDDYLLHVFPIGNLKRLAATKAQEALDSGEEVALPPMSNYERFIVHSALKEIEAIESNSVGEGEERHIQIRSKRFGRGLKKIVKKIKLF